MKQFIRFFDSQFTGEASKWLLGHCPSPHNNQMLLAFGLLETVKTPNNG
ncbi:MAG: hypothetical protein OXR68_02530 [Alphaproteobacteria bacterium]|nr:hypothetical protein [Alphaproteobacteria bacterium]MDD9919484.1 hypothetical protein [Alphaproteobacteria bacterium]